MLPRWTRLGLGGLRRTGRGMCQLPAGQAGIDLPPDALP